MTPGAESLNKDFCGHLNGAGSKTVKYNFVNVHANLLL